MRNSYNTFCTARGEKGLLYLLIGTCRYSSRVHFCRKLKIRGNRMLERGRSTLLFHKFHVEPRACDLFWDWIRDPWIPWCHLWKQLLRCIRIDKFYKSPVCILNLVPISCALVQTSSTCASFALLMMTEQCFLFALFRAKNNKAIEIQVTSLGERSLNSIVTQSNPTSTA